MHDMSDTKVSNEELQRWMNVMQQVFIEMGLANLAPTRTAEDLDPVADICLRAAVLAARRIYDTTQEQLDASKDESEREGVVAALQILERISANFSENPREDADIAIAALKAEHDARINTAYHEWYLLLDLLDEARTCFVPDDMMTEEQIAIRDRVEFAVGATTRDPDARKEDTGGDL
jgi:hypothetical protein